MTEPVQCVCGREPQIAQGINWSGKTGRMWVRCPYHNCEMRGTGEDGREAAIAAWNKMIHAIRHFDAVLNALKWARDKCLSRGLDLDDCEVCVRRFKTKDCQIRKALKEAEQSGDALDVVCPNCGGSDAEPGPKYHCPKCDAVWSVAL